MKRIAAIDIGSNAIRFAVAEVGRSRRLRVIRKLREPVRLGEDVFSRGYLSPKTIQKVLKSLRKLRRIADTLGIREVSAVATSAVRDARNRDQLVWMARQSTGVHLQVITGKEEARLLQRAVRSTQKLAAGTFLFLDLGGGSLELTVWRDGHEIATESFQLGTVRILRQLKARKLSEKALPQLIKSEMAPVRRFVRKNLQGTPDQCLGTGGNLECLGKLRVSLLNRPSLNHLSDLELSKIVRHLQSMSISDRVRYLKLRQDRADVILPAALIVLATMRAAGLKQLTLPHVGLREGLLLELAQVSALPK